MAAYQDGEPWHRKLDDPSLPPVVLHPGRHYYAGSLQDLIDIVREAEAAGEPKPRVRASGSRWALSDAALTPDWIVETNPPADHPDPNVPRLNKEVREVFERAMHPDAKAFFRSQGVTPFDPHVTPDHSKFCIFHVEAGMPICQLYGLLDSTGPNLISDTLDLDQYKGPWAMETLGGAGGQTIVGAFSTGTHGGDVHLPPIADAVQAIHLIGTEGQQWWIERELAPGIWLVDEDALKAVYPKIRVERDTNVFNAALVSVGRFGLIYSVVLRAVRQYALAESRKADDWSNVKSWLKNPAHPNFANRFVQVVVNPNGQSEKKTEHSAYPTFRTLTNLGVVMDAAGNVAGRAERCGPNACNSVPYEPDGGSALDSICKSDSPLRDKLTEMIDDLEDKRNVALVAAAIAGFLNPTLAEILLTAAIVLEGLIIALDEIRDLIPPGEMGRTIGGLANWAAETDHMDLFRALADSLVASQQKPRDLTAISYAIMDIHNYTDVGCSTSGDSLEVLFDVSTVDGSVNMVAFVDKLFQRVDELESGELAGDARAFPGYVSLRFMSKSRALLAMQKFNRVCALEIAGFRAARGTGPFMRQVERDAWQMGATIHWGQRNEQDMKRVEFRHDSLPPWGSLYLWRDALGKVSRHGRFETFSTDFTRVRGLEVVEPQIQVLTVQPSETCEGLPVLVTWNAEDNPPGTTLRLEIVPSMSSTPIETIALSSLNGSQAVVAPAGNNDFRLVASRELNSRIVTRSEERRVRAFRDHEVWQFTLTAQCLPVDGASRWAGRISFGSTIAPQLAVEEIYCVFSGTPDWRVRRSGIADVVITPSSTIQPLPTLPRLAAQDWIFFAGPTGCAGPPPQIAVQFRLVRMP